MELSKKEKELLSSVEKGEWKSISNLEKRKTELKKVAQNTIRKDKRINIRISERDLIELKKKAFDEGLPYQTYVASILHKFVKGRYTETNSI